MIIGEDTCSIVPKGLRGTDLGSCRWFNHRYSDPDDANWFLPEGVPYPKHHWNYVETCSMTYEGGWQPKPEIMTNKDLCDTIANKLAACKELQNLADEILSDFKGELK